MSCPAPHLYQVFSTMLESMLGLGSPETFWGTHLRGQRLEGWGAKREVGQGTCLVVQGLRIYFAMQGMQV